MQDITAIVYKRKEGASTFYRFIVHYNRLKNTVHGEDFSTIDDLIENLKGRVCPGDDSFGPKSLGLSKEVPGDGHFFSGYSDGGSRFPLDDVEFEQVRQALDETYSKIE